MFKIRLAAAGAFAGAMTLLVSGAAQGVVYPDCGIPLTLTGATVTGGESFKFTASAGDTDCDWTVTYKSQSKSGSGTSISGTFSTDVVSKKSTDRIVATCVREVPGTASGPAPTTSTEVTEALFTTGPSAALQAATASCPVTANVTLLPQGLAPEDDTDDNGVLPDTGGSSFWVLLVGVGLVLTGGGLTYATRRRGASH